MPDFSKVFDTPQLFAALMAASTAFTIWVLGHLVAMGVGFWKRSREKEKFIRSLYAEIDFNTADMAIFLAAPICYVTFRERVKLNKDFVPHITDARHTHFYMKNIDSISATGREYVGEVVYFYGVLDKIRAKIDGIYKKSFTNISLESRESAIRSIYVHVEEAKKTGEQLLQTMEKKYKGYKLKRKVRSLGVSEKQKAPK